MKLRPEVAAFAQMMEKKLRSNDHKGKAGWKSADTQYLLARLCDETGELLESFTGPHADQPYRGLLISSHHLRTAARVLRDYTPTLTGDYASIVPTRGVDTTRGIYSTSVEEAVDVANFCMMLIDV